MARPDRLVVVTGTGTEVGKTWVGAALLRSWRGAGRTVAARKPVQSFDPGDDPATTDAALLGAASGELSEAVCPPERWYPLALAPPMAADALGRPRVALDDLVGALAWPDPAVDVGLVEGAGGLCSPIAHDGDTLALVERLRPDVALAVADAALGVVSAVRLVARALGDTGTRLVVVLNRFEASDPAHLRSRDWLADVDGLTVVTDVASAADAVLAPTPTSSPHPA